MNILIAGYPYVRESYLKTFDYYPTGERIFFLLPKTWKAKKGKVVFTPPRRPNILTTKTFFYHSDYPVIGGLLKGFMPSFPYILWKLKKEKNINVVYSPSEPVLLTTLYQGFWTKIFGLKHIIFTWENIDYQQKLHGFNGSVKNIIIKLNIALTDGVICGNKKSQEIHKKLTKKSVATIPLSGLDMEFFKPRNRSKIFKGNSLENNIIFTFIGALGKRKGVDLILRAMPAVLKDVRAKFIIAGSGEYENQIKDLIAELGLEDNIIMIPWMDHNELVELLSITDVFLYPSISYGGWEEQFGYSMAEASLMELPIISTRSGSIDEVVLDNKTGLLVEPNNINQLIGAMTLLAKDDNLRKAMGRSGRAYIADKYSYQAIALKFADFFNKL